MSSFYQALESGYSPEDILKYLSKAIPQFSSSIKKANRAGYTAQQILGLLSKNFDTENRRGMSESERHSANRRSDAERTKFGLKAAGAAVALPIAGFAARTALSRALPSALAPSVSQSPGTISPSISNANAGNIPALEEMQKVLPGQMPSSILPQQTPVSPTNIPQVTQNVQPEVKTTNIPELITKFGLKQHIDKLSENYKNPKQIAAVLYNRFPKEMKELQKESGKPMEDAIEDYLSQNKPIEQPINIKEEQPTIAKNETVASSQGIGEVKEIRNGKALVEVNGKLHKINEDELIQSPLPEKDLADLYDDLIQGIEKKSGKQVSRNVEWAGYDPKSNELAYKPHGSDRLYHYDEISPEDVELLTSFLTKRKSTGENFIGAWQAGTESPIGAAMYQLIKKLQSERGGKGNEYKNRFETIYSALEPAILASKKKHAERKKKTKKPGID